MHLRDHPGTAAGILLACIAAHYAVSDRTTPWPRDALLPDAAPHALPPPGSSARKTLDWCRENVAIVADVAWAGACAAGAPALDDSADCTLPDERGGPLNAAREKAEQMCLDDALATDPQRR
jgi:hypothetical protein